MFLADLQTCRDRAIVLLIRRLRTATRYRKRLIQTRTSEIQRIEKTLEDAVVKLGAVASKTLTKSGRTMLDALIAGERDPAVLAEFAKSRMAPKVPEPARALDGGFEAHRAIHLRQLLEHIDWFEAAITALDDHVIELIDPFSDVIDRLQTIPGVGRPTAEVIVTETGGDMTPGPPPHISPLGGHFTSDVWLADALIEATWAAARSKDTYLAVKLRVAGPRANPNARSRPRLRSTTRS